jgi:hypothetical protein
MEYIVDAPLCGKFQSIVDWRHHLDDFEWSVAFWSEFCQLADLCASGVLLAILGLLPCTWVHISVSNP